MAKARVSPNQQAVLAATVGGSASAAPGGNSVSANQINTVYGYDPHVGARQGLPSGANGSLRTKYHTENHGKVKLWVQDISTGFSLNGTTGQSQSVRTFFPRNRIQQSVMVSCQFPNQILYADAVEWIRGRHLDKSTSLVLMVTPTWLPVKGQGENFHMHGYIKSVERKHERFVYAPELTFEFLVSRVFSPAAWKDDIDQTSAGLRVLPSWREVIEKNNVWRSMAEPGEDPKDPPEATTPAPTDNPLSNPIPGGGMDGMGDTIP